MTPTQRRGVLASPVDDDFLLLDRGRGLIHRLNRTASFVWTRCDGSASVSDLVDRLVEAFDVERATAERDVAAILEQLSVVGVVDCSGPVVCPEGETGVRGETASV